MRAVNLIPEDARTGSRSASKSGGAVYVLLGGMCALAVMVAMWAMAGSKLADDKAELTRLQAEVAAAAAQRQTVSNVDSIRTERLARAEVVRTLAAGRIDWAGRLDAIARTIPSDSWLSSLSASSAPGSGPAGGTGNSGAVASSGTGPTIQLSGCAPSQARVALLMPRLRAIPDVEHVSLVSAVSPEQEAPPGSTLECRKVTFEMVVFFTPPVLPATPAAPGTTPAPAAGTTGSAATPVATTPAPATTTTTPAQPVSAPTTGGTGQ